MSDNKDNQLFTGSISYTELVAAAKAGHSAFQRGRDGKVYVNLAIWKNGEPDKYGNDMSIKLNSKKDSGEPTKYIGNAKLMNGGGQPITQADQQAAGGDDDDLPF